MKLVLMSEYQVNLPHVYIYIAFGQVFQCCARLLPSANLPK